MPRPSSRVLLRDTLILFAGVLVASQLISGITAESLMTLILVGLVLAGLNVILKPILVLFTLPFVVFTFGLGLLLINAVLLMFAGFLVPGFYVDGFVNAFFGALLISLVSLGVNLFLAPRPLVRVRWHSRNDGSSYRSRRTLQRGDYIDV